MLFKGLDGGCKSSGRLDSFILRFLSLPAYELGKSGLGLDDLVDLLQRALGNGQVQVLRLNKLVDPLHRRLGEVVAQTQGILCNVASLLSVRILLDMVNDVVSHILSQFTGILGNLDGLLAMGIGLDLLDNIMGDLLTELGGVMGHMDSTVSVLLDAESCQGRLSLDLAVHLGKLPVRLHLVQVLDADDLLNRLKRMVNDVIGGVGGLVAKVRRLINDLMRGNVTVHVLLAEPVDNLTDLLLDPADLFRVIEMCFEGVSFAFELLLLAVR